MIETKEHEVFEVEGDIMAMSNDKLEEKLEALEAFRDYMTEKLQEELEKGADASAELVERHKKTLARTTKDIDDLVYVLEGGSLDEEEEEEEEDPTMTDKYQFGLDASDLI